jgi:hypothetical protein
MLILIHQNFMLAVVGFLRGLYILKLHRSLLVTWIYDGLSPTIDKVVGTISSFFKTMNILVGLKLEVPAIGVAKKAR